MSQTPTVLVLTGSIGMGKSTTAKMFADLGIPVWDADATVARLYAEGGAAVSAIKALVPDAVNDGTVDRSILRKAISEDPSLLKRIEAAVHPLVAEDRKSFIQQNKSHDVLLLDIPLYFETGGSVEADMIVVVSASADVQKARVLARGTMSKEDFELIKSRQMPDAEKRRRATRVIETQTLEQTQADVETLVKELRSLNA